jgi:tRNA pseudouridine55 synthase
MRSKSHSPEISGLIPVYKPAGMSSKDVSRVITKRFGRVKLGHVGTLDPDADGVLPILIGHGTKLQDYLLNMAKAYSFELTLGQFTDTMDASGTVIDERSWEHVTKEQIAEIIGTFIGPMVQTPPVYSAVKYKGKELYKYARAGKAAEDLPIEDLQRKVTIYSLKLDYFEPPRIGLTVDCSKGTYVRTLATDMAKALNTAGHVTRLTRTVSAGFMVNSCISLEQIQDENATLEALVIPINNLSIGLPTWTTDDMVTLQRIVDGQRVVIDASAFCQGVGSSQSLDVLAKSSDGRSIGIVEVTPLESGRVKLHMKRGL